MVREDLEDCSSRHHKTLAGGLLIGGAITYVTTMIAEIATAGSAAHDDNRKRGFEPTVLVTPQVTSIGIQGRF